MASICHLMSMLKARTQIPTAFEEGLLGADLESI